MSQLLSLFGVGQQSKNTDRSQQLGAWGDLSSLATGEKAGGVEATGQAQRYSSALLSGNPTAVAGAVAPTTDAVAAQTAAAGRQRAATGTSRGGGTNAQDQQSSDLISSATQTAINTQVPGAAANLGSLGTTQTEQSISAAGILGYESGQTREFDTTRSDKLLHDSVSEIAQALMAIPGFGGTAVGTAVGNVADVPSGR
jgi:hypothetical protein